MSLKDVYSVSLANTGHHHNHLIKNKITFICNENFAIRSRRRSIHLSQDQISLLTLTRLHILCYNGRKVINVVFR